MSRTFWITQAIAWPRFTVQQRGSCGRSLRDDFVAVVAADDARGVVREVRPRGGPFANGVLADGHAQSSRACLDCRRPWLARLVVQQEVEAARVVRPGSSALSILIEPPQRCEPADAVTDLPPSRHSSEPENGTVKTSLFVPGLNVTGWPRFSVGGANMLAGPTSIVTSLPAEFA